MICQQCGKRPATIHVNDIANQVNAHLCQSCAAEAGYHPGGIGGGPNPHDMFGGLTPDIFKLQQMMQQMMQQLGPKMFGSGPFGSDPFGSSPFGSGLSPTDILSGLNQATASKLGNAMNSIILGLTAPSAKSGGFICSGCGMSLPEFQQGAMYGCAKCYDTFHTIVEPLLMHYHSESQHVGKTPARGGGEAKKRQDRRRLQKQLDAAIQKEDYEEAARLRDRIKELADGAE